VPDTAGPGPIGLGETGVVVDEFAVVIVGAGPVGMMLAAELALVGVEAALLERRPGQELAGSRAGGLQSRTIEELDQRGIADRFLSQGTTAQVQVFGEVVLDISDFPTRHPYGLALWQSRIERILAEWISELGVTIRYDHEVTAVEQDETGVTVRLAGGRSLRARYIVGCDGGRSLVRKAGDIDFAGWDPTVSNLVAEVEFAEEPEWGMRRGALGVHGIGRTGEGVRARVVVTEDELKQGADDPTLQDLSAAMRAVWGTDFGVHSPTWISRFTDMARQATSYRAGRILLAGDAAHVHYPAGGQGLSIGVQDAVNLGWKLAQVVAGTSAESLLDTYEQERHPVAARVLRDTLAQVALRRADERSKAVSEAFGELLAMEEPRKRFAARLSGLGVHYDLGDGHPLLGRRMPDLDLVTADGTVRVFELLHQARPVLIALGASVGAGPWTDRVQQVEATWSGAWELPELGVVSAPAAVLVRPDGYVAWVGDGTDAGLAEALAKWFGRPHDLPLVAPSRVLKGPKVARRAVAPSGWSSVR
jgi:3-(3-hydroxy-phenyl)propionate hydroxylase